MIASKRALIGFAALSLLSLQVAGEFWSFIRQETLIEPSSQHRISTSIDSFKAQYRQISAVDDKLPIVLLDALDSPTFFYYAPSEIASRFVYLKDERAQPDIAQTIYLLLQRCCKASFPASTLGQILASTDSFLAYATKDTFRRIDGLQHSGGTVSVKFLSDDSGLFLVTFSPDSSVAVSGTGRR
jgi:hypothetical protein